MKKASFDSNDDNAIECEPNAENTQVVPKDNDGVTDACEAVVVAEKKHASKAITPFVLSLIGAAFYLTVSNVVALVLSIIARAKIKALKKRGEEIKGFALAAKIIALVTMILSSIEIAASLVTILCGALITLIEAIVAGIGAILAAIGTASSGIAAGVVAVLSAIAAALGYLLYIFDDLGVLEQIIDRIFEMFM